MQIDHRARMHAALGDGHRLRLIDELVSGDRTVNELAELSGLPGNLLAHHLNVLEEAGLIERRPSSQDRRRRYVVINRRRLDGLFPEHRFTGGRVLFVCTHNSARSQFAAALWAERTGERAESAGLQPADRVHAKAIAAASQFGVDLSATTPKGYEAIAGDLEVVISVCDRARESGIPLRTRRLLHWSVPDPVEANTKQAFRSAFGEIADRIDAFVGPAKKPTTETTRKDRR
jgi:protein-tyrosine-phosphatase